MRALLLSIDQFLRGEAGFAVDPPAGTSVRPAVLAQLRMIVLCGAVYGAVMGGHAGLGGDGWKQALLSAGKVPVLFFVTFLLCLPSYFVLNTLAGLREDFPRVLLALLAFQSLASVILAAAAPITLLMNVSTSHYNFLVFWSGILFAVASLVGHARLRRQYRPLVLRHPRHRVLLCAWTLLYWFVAIQMAWVLRPFVGDPAQPVQLVRPQAWGNAYVEVTRVIARTLRR